MSHTLRDKNKLQNRLRRIRGQLDAIERALAEEGDDCAPILQQIAACRGAMNGLMAEIVEGHVELHLLDPAAASPAQKAAASELMDVVRAYLR